MNELPPRSSTPFFRRTDSFSSATCSISSSSSKSSDVDLESDNSSSEDDSEYWSSSGSSSFRLSSSPNLRSSGAPRSQGPATAAQGSGGFSTQSRSSLKLSLCYIRARQSLASQSYDSLASSLRTLSSLLPVSSPSPTAAAWESISIFIPILERFSRDLATVLSKDETGSREFRRTSLAKEDAKALIALKQKWSRLKGGADKGKGKGKEKESELDWIEYVQNVVERVSYFLSVSM